MLDSGSSGNRGIGKSGPDPDPSPNPEPQTLNREQSELDEPERRMEQLMLPVDLGQAEDWTLASLEKVHVAAVLERMGYNLTRASKRLGIDRRTLYRKLVKYDLYGDYKRHKRTNERD